MHGERDGRTLSSPSPSMLTDETTKNDANSTASSSHNPPTELAYLPIGCSVSAKYRGAFCSAQVKAIEKQVKLKVTLLDSNETITISEEQIVHSVPLRIGNTVTVRLTSSNRRQSNDSNSHQHYSRSGLAAFINQTNPDEKQATIKQIIDNSIYTVVFNDGDEKSLRRSSLCLQGVRLYQTQYGQQKILEEMPTSPSPSLPTTSETTSANANDASSIVAIQRQGSSEQEAFPAYVLKRKALPDYMWVRSFVDGREYIVHVRDDVQPYQNNPDIQALCRSTSKQATQACEKYIKYNQIPPAWQKKKNKSSKTDDRNAGSDAENSSSNESSSSESDDEDEDEIDEETTEEKDSFVAQLFAFMDDRGTPINNIPKVQNYDLDLHRLFKIVRMFGGYNKVTKNDQWDKVHIKMGLPDESSSENGRSIELAYKKYLFAYEDLSKKLGSMNAPSAYLGGRTSMGNDSRRSLIRVRQQQQQEEEKNQKKINKTKQSPASVKQRSRKSNESRPSTDSKPVTSTKKSTPKSSSAPPNRKGPNRNKPSNVISSSSSESESESESESSDDQSSRSSSSNYKKNKNKMSASSSVSTTPKKPSIFPSTISKKIAQSTSSNSTSTSSTKTDVKKISTNTKSISSSINDNKQSKLTITIPISKSKNQSNNTSNVQSMKKTNLSSSTKEEKKKSLETKSTSIKTESKPITSSLTKKPLISSTKSSQINKTNQQQKQSTNESIKSSSLTANKTSTTITGPFKPKTTQSQTSTINNQKDRTTSISKPSSLNESRPIKSTKMNTSSTKTISSPGPIKKTKSTTSDENLTKSLPSTSTMKIPKLSSNTDAIKKSTITLEKIPKKQISKDETTKIPKIQDSSITHKSTIDQQTKSHISSPTIDTNKKPHLRDASPAPVTPTTLSPMATIPHESTSSTNLPLTLIHSQRLSHSEEKAPDIKPLEISSLVHSISTISKGSNENEILSSNIHKRPHVDEQNESIYTSEVDEQLSPSKRARRSISSQESFETFNSDPPTNVDTITTHRNTQLTYDDVSINDILLVTWGNHGTKQYHARCIEKNDEKKELYVHYTGWNSRHDAWITLDRVIERKDPNNTNNVFQQRPRRTSQISTSRQQHLDSTNSNEQSHQQQSTTGDFHSSSTLVDEEEQQNKLSKSINNERNKAEESDIDENSQGQNEIWNNVEPISSADDETLSSSSIQRPNQSTSGTETPSTPGRRRTSTNTNDHLRNEFESIEENDNENELIRDNEQTIPKRRQSRATSSNNKIDSTSIMKTEQIEEMSSNVSNILDHPHQYPLHVKEETIDSSSISQSSFQTPVLPTSSSLLADRLTVSGNLLTSPPATATGNRRASTRQKRRTVRESNNPKDTSGSAKKKPKLDNGNSILTDNGIDNIINIDQISTRSNSTDQQTIENNTIKRSRPTGRRGGKRSANQQEYENDDYRSNSPSNITMRQQLKDMFKHRPSRYNFLDLNNNLTGDERINHLKDRMRECQKAFFNLKSALVKIEKQRKGFLRKQKPILNTTSPIIQTTSTEILATPSCT